MLAADPIRIVAVDDSATMRQILEMTFAAELVDLVTVATGEAALTIARETRPQLVIADGSLSGINGYDIARAIKTDPALVGTGVVVLASDHNPYDANQGASAGVDAHVLKPFETQALIDTVFEVLKAPRATMAEIGTLKGTGAEPRSSSIPTPFQRSHAPAPPDPVLEIIDEPLEPEDFTPPARLTPPIEPPPAIESNRPPVSAAPVANATGPQFENRLQGLGLNADQVSGVLAISREVIEQVVWEVVPDLAETIIREEIRRLTAE